MPRFTIPRTAHCESGALTMARYYGSTTQRGLGAPHIADKKRLMARHRDGDPCWRCGQPMYKSQALDRDHVVDRALGGTKGPAVLAHASCNRAAGGRLGNQLRPLDTPRSGAGHDVFCPVCGKKNGRKSRSCEVCGGHYHPGYGEQRTCSRACGVVMRRRIYGPAGRRPQPPRTRQPPAPLWWTTVQPVTTDLQRNQRARQARQW